MKIRLIVAMLAGTAVIVLLTLFGPRPVDGLAVLAWHVSSGLAGWAAAGLVYSLLQARGSR